MKANLSIRIAVDPQQEPETPTLVDFELTNEGDSDVLVLKPGTPLEGLSNDCFHVTRDGEPVIYDGRLVKRGPATRDSYLRIAPGETAKSTIDLSRAYQVGVPGRYTVAFCGRLPDVVSESLMNERVEAADMPRQPARIKVAPKKFTVRKGLYGRPTKGEMARLVCEERLAKAAAAEESPADADLGAAKPPTLKGGTASQQSKTKAAYENGYNLTVAALSGLSNDATYKEWFGTYAATRFAKVKEVYTKVRDGMEKTTFTYDLTGGGDCEPGDYAYTYHGATEVWLCSGFWNAPATGTDSQAGTVLHEQSHASAGTDDIEYGQTDCRQLAKDDPNDAVKNADNYEYYAGG